jgi:hypothetical protein
MWVLSIASARLLRFIQLFLESIDLFERLSPDAPFAQAMACMEAPVDFVRTIEARATSFALTFS